LEEEIENDSLAFIGSATVAFIRLLKGKAQYRRIATTTDLNKAINEKFAEAGIEISFPQRDVHLDAKGPLDVRVVSGQGQSGSKDV